MIFICYDKCSTCKKAEKFLIDNCVEFEKRDIKENNPTKKELEYIYKLSGVEIKKLFNTSGVKYRQLNLKDKLKEMTDDEKLSLLSTDGMLVKRPILLGDDFAIIGFKEDDYKLKLNIK